MTIPGAFVAGNVLLAADMNGLPAGLINLASTGTAHNGIGTSATAVTGISAATPTVANRRYKISVHIPVRQRTSAGLVTVEICKAGTTILNTAQMSLGIDEYGTFSMFTTEKPGAGTTTYTARLKTSLNTVDMVAAGPPTAFISVEDVGIV